jgi:Uncharacterized conserved protein
MNEQDIRRKRAYYRACHRGTKEMDILLGQFAEIHLPRMSEDDLTCFEEVLSLPDPVLDRMIRGSDRPGDGVADMIERVRRHHGLNAS